MPTKADTRAFDPTGPGDAHGSVFGLPFDEAQSSVVLLPVPWEATTSYGRGTVDGPAAIRVASPQLDLFDAELAGQGLARPWAFGIHMRAEDPRVRAWNERASEHALHVLGHQASPEQSRQDLAVVNTLSHELDAWVHAEVEALLARGKIVGVVGGDHSVAFGAIAAHAARFPGLGILHVDAHADLRRAYEGFECSHASVLRKVVDELSGVATLVQVGVRDLSEEEFAYAAANPKITSWYEHALRRRLAEGTGWAAVCADIVGTLPQQVYVSFDIDGLDPALCPSTGTPVPGGLSFAEATRLIAAISESGRTIVGFDLVEVAPSGRDGDQGAG
ncbi:MAG TPA: arginase family protein, partial [Nannocystaceae bacterium]|nr:arginase family protein [Nannocystaceae bacterium]